MEETIKKPVRIRKSKAVPKVIMPMEERTDQKLAIHPEEEEERRAEIAGDTLRSVRELFLNPVDYALPEEMKTARKAMLRNLAEARKRVHQRIPERITLNDMLLSSFNMLLNQVQRAEMNVGEDGKFPDERDAVWYMVQYEQCKLLATLTDLPVAGEGITYDMADITFFLTNSIDLDSQPPTT